MSHQDPFEQFATHNIKFLVLDVDGVMTDGGMYYTEGGDQFKKFNTKDGMAIKVVRQKGMNVAFLSSGSTEHIIQNRFLKTSFYSTKQNAVSFLFKTSFLLLARAALAE